MIDLTTRYLGLDLVSPIVASASPLTGDAASAAFVAESGAAAIVMPSLFEEETLDPEVGLQYLARLEAIKARTTVPVIASLNASNLGAWVRDAHQMEDAGADALELNLYHVAADPLRSGADVEASDLEVVASVRSELGIPLAVKLSPYYSSTAAFARAVIAAGADGLVLFNRFYQPDIDLQRLEVVNRIELSRPWELRLPLRWIAILRPQLGAAVSLAATSGVHSGIDVVKALLVGADVTMLTSALLQHGVGHLRTVRDELETWMAAHDYDSVTQLRGRVTPASSGDAGPFERTQYRAALQSWIAPPHLIPSAAGA